MILKKEELEAEIAYVRKHGYIDVSDFDSDVREREDPKETVGPREYADTLEAYADIVQRVAEDDCADGEDLGCRHCGGEVRGGGGERITWVYDHEPDCIYIAARGLRGLDAE